MKILANKLLEEKFEEEYDEFSDDELAFQVKKLSERAGSDTVLNGEDEDDDDKFILEDEDDGLNKPENKDSVNGGYRDYSATQEQLDYVTPSYKAFTEEGVAFKTFYHANTFNEKLTKSRRRIPIGSKKFIGSVQEITVSTNDKSQLQNYQSCRFISISNSVHSIQSKRVTVNHDIQRESQNLMHIAIKASHNNDLENDVIEFDRDSCLNSNKSLNHQVLGYSSKDISFGFSPSSNIFSSYGDSTSVFNRNEITIGFSHYTSAGHLTPYRPPIMIGGLQAHPDTPVSISLAKKTDLELIDLAERNRKECSADSEMVHTHKHIQKIANADIIVPKSLMIPYQKPPMFRNIEIKEKKPEKPKQTIKIQDVGKLPTSISFMKPPICGTKSTTLLNKASGRRARTLQIESKAFLKSSPADGNSTLLMLEVSHKTPCKQKKLMKWASQKLIGEPTAAYVCSPSRKNSLFMKMGSYFWPQKVNIDIPENNCLNLKYKQGSSTLKNLLTAGPIKKYIDKRSKDSRSLLHKNASFNLDTLSFSTKKRNPHKATPQFFNQTFDVDNDICQSIGNQDTCMPLSLDLLTEKTSIELVSRIKQILMRNCLDPYTVDIRII